MEEYIVLKNPAIFDGVNEELIRGKSLVISGGKISRICDSTESFENARVFDLTGSFLTPGFIDCHMHTLLEEVPQNKNRVLTMVSAGGEPYPNADSAVALLGVDNSRKLLKAGFTTVMDGGGRNFIECALKEAISKGFVQGPELYLAGKQITTNHAHFIGFSEEAFGPYGMRKAVRDLMWWGVDFVKLQLSPPIRMVGRKSDATDFTQEEIAAAIDEAHNYGVPVHAHIRSAAALKKFLLAGGDYVIHGTGIDDEGIEMMLKYNKILLPTLLSPSPHHTKELLDSKTQSVIDLLNQTAETHWAGIRKAYKAGVRIAFSTDSGTLGNHVGLNYREFLNLTEIGMSNVEALRCATSVASEVAGRSDSIGRIKEGCKANITVLKDNPLENINATADVLMTMVNGRILYNRSWEF